MNKETFDKFFRFNKKENVLYIISNIVTEQIVDNDVDNYIKNNYNSNGVSLFIDKNVTDISSFNMKGHSFLNVDVDKENCFFQECNNCLLSKDSSILYYCELPLKKKNFVIPKGVKKIMPYCFLFENDHFYHGEVKLENIIFNDELLEIKRNAFRGSYNGQTIFINERLINVEEESFNCCGLKFNIGKNTNFKNEHSIISFKNTVVSIDPSQIIFDLQYILDNSSKINFGIILANIRSVLLDIINGIDSNETKILTKYLSQNDGFIIARDTLLAYYGRCDCLKIPNGVKNVYDNYQGKDVSKIYIPKSLQSFDLIDDGQNRIFCGVKKIVVEIGNLNFYANKYFLYDINKKQILHNMIKDKEIIIDDPIINNINDILRFSPVETIIFDNDFLLTINGQLGRRHSCVKNVVFNSSKIVFSENIFNGMTTIEHIYVKEEEFAKILFEKISEQYKDKIFCLCENAVGNGIVSFRGKSYRPLKNKRVLKKSVEKILSLMNYVKENPTFTMYNIAEFLSCTPATALIWLKKMVSEKVLTTSDFAKERERTKIYEQSQAEKRIFDLLRNQETNIVQLVYELDPSEKRQYFYFSLIDKLIDAGVIDQKIEQGHYRKLRLGNENEFFEKIEKCKIQILNLLETHKLINVVGHKLSLDDYCDSITEHALNELVYDNSIEITEQYDEEKGWFTNYRYLKYKNSLDLKPIEIKYNIVSIEEQKILNAIEFVNMCREIMTILPEQKVKENWVKKLIKNNKITDRFFYHALENLNSQGAIIFNIPTIKRKEPYSKWQKEIGEIKEFIIKNFEDKDFVSKEFLIHNINNKFKCLYALEELVAEKKIIETSKQGNFGTDMRIDAYKLVK